MEDSISTNINDNIIENKYDINTAIDKILKYYSTIISNIKNNKKDAKIEAVICKKKDEEYEIVIKQNTACPSRDNLIKQINDIGGNHPNWIYSPIYFNGVDKYTFVSRPQNQKSYIMSVNKKRIKFEDIDILRSDGTDIIIHTTGNEDIIKIGEKIREKISSLDHIPNRKYTLKKNNEKEVKYWD